MYKSVWPTSARDFVVLTYCKRIDETTRIRGGFSVSIWNCIQGVCMLFNYSTCIAHVLDLECNATWQTPVSV